MAHEVWITGIGLTSSLGEGLDAHWRAMAEAAVPQPVVDLETAAPFAFYPMVPLDLDKQIPRRADQRQMEPWQRLGTYTAGLALEDAGLVGDAERLGQTHMVVAAGAGERDMDVDGDILKGIGAAPVADEFLNERLSNDLRPTLFLAQLPNLLAGNISIVHKVTGSSRTFLGEEISGVSAVEIAWRRIRAGQGDVFLVGGASLAGRKDMILQRAIGGTLWQGPPLSVWARPEQGRRHHPRFARRISGHRIARTCRSARPAALRADRHGALGPEPPPSRRSRGQGVTPVRGDRRRGRQPAGCGAFGRHRHGRGDARGT